MTIRRKVITLQISAARAAFATVGIHAGLRLDKRVDADMPLTD
jgi:hypothetical protein